jgi:sulfur carrier protein
LIPLSGANRNGFVNAFILVFRSRETSMKITVNGDSTDIRDGSTVAGLLEDLRIGRDRVAVEVGLEIVPKAHYDTHVLLEGDRVEIVQFVGGGQQRCLHRI